MELLDINDVARLLRVSRTTACRLRAAGKLPEPVAVSSRCLRWDREALERWVRQGCPRGKG